MKPYSTTAATLMLLGAPGALSSEPLGKLRGAVYLESDSHIQETSSTSAVKITENDMATLVEAFCRAAVSISDAFWDNGGKSHSQYGAYPQAACDAAYEEAFAALSGAYNYPGSVLFKPTLATAPYTFRPTKEGALSYLIGTDCLLKSGNSDEQFPPGNNGSTFREYGFGLANYGTHTGISDCKWVAEGYVTGENAGIAQGKVIFERTEGGNSVVDKTFSFGVFDSSGGIVITGHHSSSEIEAGKSTQYVIGDEDGGGGFQIQRN